MLSNHEGYVNPGQGQGQANAVDITEALTKYFANNFPRKLVELE